MKRTYLNALILPWLIAGAVGAVSAGIVGAAAANLMTEAKAEKAREREAVKEVTMPDGVPELVIVPELIIIEGNNADEYYPDAP